MYKVGGIASAHTRLVGYWLPVLVVDKSVGCLLPGFGYLKKLFHSSLVLCIESKTDFWLLCETG
jgi:hypothetical protein